ncbi:hypothetical protein KKD80_01910 [Patescibacteria group bacterium]|nr:hypothetical protein [Patescibacteria group bacterium]
MAEEKNLAIKEKILRAEEAYQKFSDIMAKLSRRQRAVLDKAIKEIETRQIEKLRKKLNLN